MLFFQKQGYSIGRGKMIRYSRYISGISMVLLSICALAVSGEALAASTIHFPLSYSEDASRCPENVGIPKEGSKEGLFYPVIPDNANSGGIKLDVVYERVSFPDSLMVSFAGEKPEELLNAKSFSYEAGEYGYLSGVVADLNGSAKVPPLPTAALLYKKGGWKPEWLGTFIDAPDSFPSPNSLNPVTKLLKLSDVYLVFHRLGGSQTYVESPDGSESRIFSGDIADGMWVVGVFDVNGDGDLEFLVLKESGYSDIPSQAWVVTVHEDKFSVCR